LGWGGLSNGKLLSAAEEAGFAAIVTVDRNMQYQQSLEGRKISAIFLRASKNDLRSLKPLAEAVTAELKNLRPRSKVVIKALDWPGE
jgi:hypothetical protein